MQHLSPLPRRVSPAVLVVLAIVALALVVAGLSVRLAPVPGIAAQPALARRGPATPPAAVPPPSIEPLVLLETSPDRARAINAAIPFSRAPILPARRFVFAGSAVDRERALTCLASAAWYEAGDDPVGQRAVVQVVLNRMRHPAYPKTVCGVVFQGSERSTGCQFTFTCDGALARLPSIDGWRRARAVAEQALGGAVDRSVGTATHYHTNWVVPYWSGSLDKISEVHTHLFFRWPGWWGQPAAFSGRYAGGEAIDARLIALAGPEAAGEGMTLAFDPAALEVVGDRAALTVAGVAPRDLKGNLVRLANADGSEFGLELDAKSFPGNYAVVAYNLCKPKTACIVAGWIRPEQIPAALPVPVQALRTVSFLYRKNVQLGREQSFWNCRQFARDDPAQCLPGTDLRPSDRAAVAGGSTP